MPFDAGSLKWALSGIVHRNSSRSSPKGHRVPPCGPVWNYLPSSEMGDLAAQTNAYYPSYGWDAMVLPMYVWGLESE